VGVGQGQILSGQVTALTRFSGISVLLHSDDNFQDSFKFSLTSKLIAYLGSPTSIKEKANIQ